MFTIQWRTILFILQFGNLKLNPWLNDRTLIYYNDGTLISTQIIHLVINTDVYLYLFWDMPLVAYFVDTILFEDLFYRHTCSWGIKPYPHILLVIYSVHAPSTDDILSTRTDLWLPILYNPSAVGDLFCTFTSLQRPVLYTTIYLSLVTYSQQAHFLTLCRSTSISWPFLYPNLLIVLFIPLASYL